MAYVVTDLPRNDAGIWWEYRRADLVRYQRTIQPIQRLTVACVRDIIPVDAQRPRHVKVRDTR